VKQVYKHITIDEKHQIEQTSKNGQKGVFAVLKQKPNTWIQSTVITQKHGSTPSCASQIVSDIDFFQCVKSKQETVRGRTKKFYKYEEGEEARP